MHPFRVKYTCGRPGSRFRYTSAVCNSYRFSQGSIRKTNQLDWGKKRKKYRLCGAKFSGSSLAVLYNPLTPVPTKAYNELDKAVNSADRPQPFTIEAHHRRSFLFELYEEHSASLFTEPKVKIERLPRSRILRVKSDYQSGIILLLKTGINAHQGIFSDRPRCGACPEN